MNLRRVPRRRHDVAQLSPDQHAFRRVYIATSFASSLSTLPRCPRTQCTNTSVLAHIRREFLHPAGFSTPLSALYTICESVRMCSTGVFPAQVASAISTAQNSASATLSTSNDRARTRPRVDTAAIPARCPVPSNASVATTMPSSMGWMIEFFSFRVSAKSACSAGTTVLNLRTFLNSAGYSRTTALNKPTVWSVFPTATSKNHDVASFPMSTSLHTSARHSPRADSATTATSLSSA